MAEEILKGGSGPFKTREGVSTLYREVGKPPSPFPESGNQGIRSGFEQVYTEVGRMFSLEGIPEVPVIRYYLTISVEMFQFRTPLVILSFYSPNLSDMLMVKQVEAVSIPISAILKVQNTNCQTVPNWLKSPAFLRVKYLLHPMGVTKRLRLLKGLEINSRYPAIPLFI